MKEGTAALSRNHVIEVAPSKLVTVTGGKWTTYRRMAQDTIDRVLQVSRKDVIVILLLWCDDDERLMVMALSDDRSSRYSFKMVR